MSKSIGALLSSFAKLKKKSQTALAEEAGITHASVNRFFNGKANLSSEALISVLKALDIDLVEIILEKQNKLTLGHDKSITTKLDAIEFLFNNLEKRGQQTQLKQLEWINDIAGIDTVPKSVKEILKKEITLV